MTLARAAVLGSVGLAIVAGSTKTAHADPMTFPTGSLIIPMDVDYQDAGMLKAFGLLDKLLRAGVPVQWVIKTPKVVVDASKGKFEDDFTASATDFKTPATVITAHGYRGGPFVILAADAAAATSIITSWQTSNTTAVHVTTAPFTANVSRTLTAAPRIAVLGDGKEDIAFTYLNAAGILDEQGKLWANTSVDLVTESQAMGPTSTNHKDGALFRPSGQPAYCEIMTMHWGVTETEVPEVTAEMANFLNFPVHVNAECQAVNAIEGAPPTGGRMNFVTTKGFQWPAPAQPGSVDFLNSSLPFAQMDGAFGTVGGSEPAYALGPGSAFYDTGIVMVKGAGKAIGLQDVWMTGYANTGKGTCPVTSEFGCVVDGHALGKVSYLGGHQYDVKTPISTNPKTQGTRLFLNSLYEAGCVTAEGQPKLTFTKAGPATTSTSTVTYTISWTNAGAGPALSVTLKDPLPAGSTFVSATGGGTYSAGVVTWSLGDIGKDATGSVDLTITLPAFGTYSNTANAAYKVGLSDWTKSSNTVSTTWVDCATDAAASCVCTSSCGDAGAGDGSLGDSGVDATLDTDVDSTVVDSDVDSTIVDSTVVDSSTGADTTVATDTGSDDTLIAIDTGPDDTGSAAADTLGGSDTAPADDSATTADTGTVADTGSIADTGSLLETGFIDDVGSIDAGSIDDSGTGADSASTDDTGSTADDTGSTTDDTGSTTDDTGSTTDDTGSTTDDAAGTDDSGGAASAEDLGTGANGGCGCNVQQTDDRGLWAAGALLAAFAIRRRRRNV